jgi:hypothetical protein
MMASTHLILSLSKDAPEIGVNTPNATLAARRGSCALWSILRQAQDEG